METQNETSASEAEAAAAKRNLISPLNPAMRGALLSCLLLALAIGITGIVAVFRYHGFLTMLIVSLLYIIAVLIVSVLLTLIFAAIKKLRWQTFLVIIVSFFLCLTTMLLLLYIFPLLISCLIAVYLAIMLVSGRYRVLKKPGRILRYGLLGLFSVLSVFMLALTLWPGLSLKPGDRPDKAVLALPYADKNLHEAFLVPDNPSMPGSYNYLVHYYAAPGQKIDPYPGQSVMPAPTVDASELLEGWSFIRKSQLGYEPNALPLNAQVWMPEGSGPFPLALIVHGNHESCDRSDGGYAYLCDLLASRGIIAVAVDENFLNYSLLYDILLFTELKNENCARAFILLEHLSLWYEWNADASHPFYGKIDFDNIALIGHSRGGEAAALAAAFAKLSYYPDNGRVILNYPFRIKSVVAIAPVHQQNNPAGLEISLENINYLVLHGGHDMDVSSFMGANMYSRVDVSEYGVKARVWMLHANHGQFNTFWGATDLPGIANLIANTKLLMPMEEQQQAAKVFIGAFLESTLKGKDEYNALFKDFAHTEQWLPPDIYITCYADSSVVLLDSFDSGFDLVASKSKLATYSAVGFDTWTQTELPGKMKNSNRVLQLQWGNKEYAEKYGPQTPVFTIEFAEGLVSAGDKLYVSLCSGKENVDGQDVSFQIRLTDSARHISIMSIDDFGGVTDPIDALIYKPLFLAATGKREPVLQMICIATEQFDGLKGSIASMDWIMDTVETSKNGQILYVDDIRVERLADPKQ
jgi:dienelactone hydrolase